MFSTGQWIFAALFVVCFVIVISIMYRKDLMLHHKHYKGSLRILVGFILFVILLFVLKVYLQP
ncbi:hypothetical protein NBT05_00180 [Aquimarina sp. ERC-38]|nr:hypothetical protein NBT05_00180 [Aquimarina sp. ERC-38]